MYRGDFFHLLQFERLPSPTECQPNKELKITIKQITAMEIHKKRDKPPTKQPSIILLIKFIFERLYPQYGQVHWLKRIVFWHSGHWHKSFWGRNATLQCGHRTASLETALLQFGHFIRAINSLSTHDKYNYIRMSGNVI